MKKYWHKKREVTGVLLRSKIKISFYDGIKVNNTFFDGTKIKNSFCDGAKNKDT